VFHIPQGFGKFVSVFLEFTGNIFIRILGLILSKDGFNTLETWFFFNIIHHFNFTFFSAYKRGRRDIIATTAKNS
jgi:hypothetical protein